MEIVLHGTMASVALIGNLATLSDVYAATGHTLLTLDIVGANPEPKPEGEVVETAGGKLINPTLFRLKMDVGTTPVNFGGDYVTLTQALIAVLQSEFLYAEFTDYDQAALFVNDIATQAYAVTRTGYATTHSPQFGTKRTNITLEGYKRV